MKDRNSLIGLVLIAGIMFFWMFMMQPSDEEVAEQKRLQDSIAQVDEERKQKAEQIAAEIQQQEAQDSIKDLNATVDSVYKDVVSVDQVIIDSLAQAKAAQEQQDKYGLFADAAQGKEDTIVIENENLRITLSTLGGRMISAELKNYRTYDSMRLFLFDKDSSRFNMELYDDNSRRTYATEDLYFNIEGSSFEVSGSDKKQISMRLYAGAPDKYIEYLYELKGNTYLLDLKINVVGLDDLLESVQNSMSLQWELSAPTKEKFAKTERQTTSAYWKYKDEDPDYITERGSDDKENLIATIDWVSFKQQHFSTSIISKTGFGKQNASAEAHDLEGSSRYTTRFGTELEVQYNDEPYEIQFYLGPNQYDTLKAMGIGLEEQLNLGWPVIKHMSIWVIMPIFHKMEEWGLGYGLIILLLTLIIKLALFPITYKNYKSSAKMRVLKPQVDKIKEKYKDEAMKAQQETMAFYRKVGVSPMAGCLPALLQMPILYAMFRFFPSSIELRQQGFWWAEDLSTFDSILELGFEIPFYGDHVSLWTLLMAASMFFYMKYNMSMTASAAGPQGAQMKIMTYFMPFMMLAFFNEYACGLSYYYFLANIISVGQQFVIKKWFIDEEAVLASLEANKKKPKKKSRFQQALEDAQKKQKGQIGKRGK